MPIAKDWELKYPSDEQLKIETKMIKDFSKLDNQELLARIVLHLMKIENRLFMLNSMGNALVDLTQGALPEMYNDSTHGELNKIRADLDTLCRVNGEKPGWYRDEY